MQHAFHATAFIENLPLKELAPAYPGARRTPHQLSYATASGGTVFIYPFGAIVFLDLPPQEAKAEMARLHAARPGLTTAHVIDEALTARVIEGSRVGMDSGVLVVDSLGAERAGIVAMTVAQSAAMDYYDRAVDGLFAETARLVDRLEARGSVPMSPRPLHKFIGRAMSTRNEVLSILHLLDKPDAIWDDPGADRLYEELRIELDLADRYEALEAKLRSVQESLELMLGVVRERRLVILELAIVLLIVFEIVLSLARRA